MSALESLYSGNYFNTLTNNPYPGYGLMTTYISAINTYFLIGSNDANFLAINYLFIFLFITFLFEISKNKKVFLITSLSFASIIISNHWFTYIFGSLLSECISSFCFGILISEIINNKSKIILKIYLFIFIYLDLFTIQDNF